MLHTILAALSFGIAVPPAATATSDATWSAMCPATTESGRALVAKYVSSNLHDRSRARGAIPRSTPNQVRALETPDAVACGTLVTALEREATLGGFEFQRAGLEFYQVGEFYFATRRLRPSSCRPGPSHACLDVRWQTLHIFDRELNLLRSIAL